MKTAPLIGTVLVFEPTKIGLIGQKWRFRNIDFDHLTDEKHIGIFINYHGKFGDFYKYFYDKTISSYRILPQMRLVVARSIHGVGNFIDFYR